MSPSIVIKAVEILYVKSLKPREKKMLIQIAKVAVILITWAYSIVSSAEEIQLAQLSEGFNAQQKYMASCFACHSTGAAGAPSPPAAAAAAPAAAPPPPAAAASPAAAPPSTTAAPRPIHVPFGVTIG